MKRKTLLIVSSLILLSVITRSGDLLSGNIVFGFDQGRDFLKAREIVEDRNFTLIGSELGGGFNGFGGLFHGPFYYYLVSLVYVIFGGNPIGGNVLVFLIGTGSVLYFYILLRELFSERVSYMGALFYALSPVFIWQSRMLWNTHPSSIFVLLVLFCLIRFIKTQKFAYYLGALFLAGFIYNFQFSISIGLVGTLLIYFFVYVREKMIQKFLLAVGALVLAFMPFLLFDGRRGFQGILGLLGYFFSPTKSTSGKSWLFWMGDHLNTFYYGFLDTFPRPHIWFLSLFGVLLFALTFYLYRREERVEVKRFLIFLVCSPFFSFFVFMFLRNSIYTYYLAHLNVVYLVFLVFVISRLDVLHKYLNRLFVVCVCVLVGWGLYSGIKETHRIYTHPPHVAFLSGKLRLIDRIYELDKDKNKGLLVFVPAVYTYDFDYLMKWYGVEKYGYELPREKRASYLLVAEVDATQPWSYKGWIETVVRPEKEPRFENFSDAVVIGVVE